MDEFILRLEEETMKSELAWLLITEFPPLYSEIIKQLKDCIYFISRTRSAESTEIHFKNSKESDPIISGIDPRDDPPIIRFEGKNKTIEGWMKIDGWNIVESKISITLQKVNKGKPLVFGIFNLNPWRLTQVQNAYNYFLMALNELKEFSEYKKTYTAVIDVQTTIIILEKVQDYMKQALDQFSSNRNDIEPNTQSREIFVPRLTENLNVQFEVVGISYLISAHLLQGGSKQQIGEDQRQHSEIIESVQCTRDSRKLAQVKLYIHNISSICFEFREKIISLSSYIALETEYDIKIPKFKISNRNL